MYPNQRRLSERSDRRYYQRHNIHRLDDNEIEGVVSSFVTMYGHQYGISLMQGSVRAYFGVTGHIVSQRRMSRALRRVAPEAFEARTRDVLERTNPIPYFAPYFGYKAHMDQNEKLGQCYGCTHVAIIDSCSRMICGFASMGVKNPIMIYDQVFRPVLLLYGLWEQLRIDHGQEFSFCIFIQELLKQQRNNTSRAPWKQTASTENYTIERFWPELNPRVNIL